MAPPESAGAGDYRDLGAELDALSERLDDARRYLGIDALRERRGTL
jgi:hypothetical protein